MTIAILFLLTVGALAGFLYLVGRVIDSDGHGQRPPPRSHHDEAARQRLARR